VRARVLIRPKAGILDPQGQTVERALRALGFESARNVRVGRLVELDADDPAQVPEMCERLLANPLIEDYEVLVVEPTPEERAMLAPERAAVTPEGGAASGERTSGP
jgi:phosphoribosylformylglycinamidine synthase subunit PurS